jgi:hypothetical protein
LSKNGPEFPVFERNEFRYAPRQHEPRTEFHRLHFASPDEIGTRNSGWKAHVVFDPARRSGLPPDRGVFDDERVQTLRPGIDARRDPGRAGTDDQYIERIFFGEIAVESQQPCDLLRRRLGQNLAATEDHRRPIRRDPADGRDPLRFVTAHCVRRIR